MNSRTIYHRVRNRVMVYKGLVNIKLGLWLYEGHKDVVLNRVQVL